MIFEGKIFYTVVKLLRLSFTVRSNTIIMTKDLRLSVATHNAAKLTMSPLSLNKRLSDGSGYCRDHQI